MALVVAQEVPTSSTMAVPHGAAGVGVARRRMREELLAAGAPEPVVDDAILILSELLSNACRHARPLSGGSASGFPGGPDGAGAQPVVRAAWSKDVKGEVTIAVTDGGGPTRPLPATPSVTARGGRGLSIITALASDWGVRAEENGMRGDPHGVTVWAVLPPGGAFSGRLAAGLGLDMDLAAVDEPA